jgi:putative membrane protein
VARRVTHPLVALAAFVVLTSATHLPVVTDNLMGSQAGSFLVDSAWLTAGLLFWWPIIMPGGPAWFAPLVRMGYLVASMVLMTAPNAMITFSELPLYATFELAPPIPGVSALQDQRLAGIAMRFGSAVAVWTAISILFFRWSRRETQLIDEEMAAQRRPRDPAPQ